MRCLGYAGRSPGQTTHRPWTTALATIRVVHTSHQAVEAHRVASTAKANTYPYVKPWPANIMWRKRAYSGFETCFGPSTQGAGARTHSKPRFCAIFEKKRGGGVRMGDWPSTQYVGQGACNCVAWYPCLRSSKHHAVYPCLQGVSHAHAVYKCGLLSLSLQE